MKERDIRILLVDDHDLVLQGLKRIVECSLPEIKNVCTASSGQEALHLIASQRFNLFVLDMELPDISGMDIIVRIREKDPRARIIVNTMHEEIWFIKDLIQSAVDGILFKSIDSTKIAEAIRRVLDGGTYYCPYAEHVRAQMRRSDEGRREELTLRELDVLKRISEGKTALYRGNGFFGVLYESRNFIAQGTLMIVSAVLIGIQNFIMMIILNSQRYPIP